MDRSNIEEDIRVMVIGAPRHKLPVGTRGTIWQAHANPAGIRVGRVLWDNKQEGMYFLEAIPLDQMTVVLDKPPRWAANRIRRWRRKTYMGPRVAGPMQALLKGFKVMVRDKRKGKGDAWG